MKVLLFGANGQLGSDINAVCDAADIDVVPCNHDQVDITSQDRVLTVLREVKPTHVVNCAAMTNVPLCETEKARAMAINVAGAKHIATAAQELGAKLFHISTDYVFDGEKGSPYLEIDPAHPLNEYGRTKQMGEAAVLESGDRSVVMRVSGVYGVNPCRGKQGKNFIDTIAERLIHEGQAKVVHDEILTPTWAVSIAEQIKALLDSEIAGIVHATNEGRCSWYEFACEAITLLGIPGEIEPVSSAVFPSTVKRPRYSVLENAVLKKHDLNIFCNWQEALARYITVKKSR